MALACGVSVAIVTTWFLATGMWGLVEEADVIGVAEIATIVFLTNAFLCTSCAYALTKSAPKCPIQPWYLSMHHPITNVFHDHFLNGILFLIIVFLSFAAAILTNSVTSIPALVLAASAIVGLMKLVPESSKFISKSSQTMLAHESNRISPIMMARCGNVEDEAVRLRALRIKNIDGRSCRSLWISNALSLAVLHQFGRILWLHTKHFLLTQKFAPADERRTLFKPCESLFDIIGKKTPSHVIAEADEADPNVK